MKKINAFAPVLGLAMVLTLSACGTTYDAYDRGSDYPQRANSNYPPPAVNGIYSGFGVVRSIEVVRQDRPDNSIGAGTIVGAVIGGVIGSQIGGGNGSNVAAVAGAAGGAYAGHQIEKSNRQQVDAYQVGIRMENGTSQTLLLNSSPDLRVGDRVEISNGVVRRY